MPREPKISWRQSQQDKLSRSVAKFNAKITRELKKNPELSEYLPDRLNVNLLKEKIRTAKDLDRVVKSIDRAFKPDSFKPVEIGNVKTTKFELKETKLRVNQINRDRARELFRADPSPERGTMSIGKDASLQPKSFNPKKMSQKEWDKFTKWAEKEMLSSAKSAKMEIYKANYLRAFKDTLGDDNPLYRRIAKIDADKLIELYYKDPVMQLSFVYTRNEAETKYLSIESHLEYWGY